MAMAVVERERQQDERPIILKDRAAIAGMVQYPIRTFISGWIIPIVDRQTFITSFDAFFTEEIKDLVAEAAARPRVLKTNDVIVLGNGALRAMRINGRFRGLVACRRPATI